MVRVMSDRSATGWTLTLEQWAALPEDASGELVDGRLEEEEVPDFVHELVVTWLAHAFRSWLAGRGGFVGGSGAKFAVRPSRGRKPDLSVYLPGGAAPPRRGLVRTPPDVAVEVISPRPADVRRDRLEKMHDYAVFGIRWYWLVDPDARCLEIFERGHDGRYVRALGVSADRVDAVPGCEGLVLDLAALWREIDALGPDEPVTG
jgi:Uma2 family endonuclease